jgi:hypothetical protein
MGRDFIPLINLAMTEWREICSALGRKEAIMDKPTCKTRCRWWD